MEGLAVVKWLWLKIINPQKLDGAILLNMIISVIGTIILSHRQISRMLLMGFRWPEWINLL